MKRTQLIAPLAFLTVGMAIALSPLPSEQPKTQTTKPKTITAQVHAEVVEPTPTPTPEPDITWQDNPNGCNEQTQWIAAEAPFTCINKPQPVQTLPKPTNVPNRPVVDPQTVSYSGDKYSWMAAAGIPQSDWQYVDFIVTKEAGWNPVALNPSSGACSLAQALPCSKIPGDWRDPVNALRWQHGYVVSRYGSYAGAYAWWLSHSWY